MDTVDDSIDSRMHGSCQRGGAADRVSDVFDVDMDGVAVTVLRK
jgi:hypothetical protein